MLVRFLSSETGEILMFSEPARILLQAIGKATTARGTFTREEMSGAAAALKAAVARTEAPPTDQDDEASGQDAQPVVLGQRAWPLIDMLERTAQGGPKANIVWEASADF